MNRGTRITPCHDVRVPPEVRGYAHDMETTVSEVINSRLSWSTSHPTTTLHNVHKHAINWIKTNNFKTPPTDKDGGFCLMKKTAFYGAINEKLNTPDYTEISREDLRPGPLVSRMQKLCKAL
eukprot:9834630-Karenia_brevis.AAC.1